MSSDNDIAVWLESRMLVSHVITEASPRYSTLTMMNLCPQFLSQQMWQAKMSSSKPPLIKKKLYKKTELEKPISINIL